MSELATIARGTVMHAAEHQGVACKFTTAYDVVVAPLRLAEVRFQSIVAAPPAVRLPPDLGAAISITLEATGATSTLDGLPLPALRLFLDGEPSFCATLRDSLFRLRVVPMWKSMASGMRWTQCPCIRSALPPRMP